jgi:hypothetical protein
MKGEKDRSMVDWDWSLESRLAINPGVVTWDTMWRRISFTSSIISQIGWTAYLRSTRHRVIFIPNKFQSECYSPTVTYKRNDWFLHWQQSTMCWTVYLRYYGRVPYVYQVLNLTWTWTVPCVELCISVPAYHKHQEPTLPLTTLSNVLTLTCTKVLWFLTRPTTRSRVCFYTTKWL